MIRYVGIAVFIFVICMSNGLSYCVELDADFRTADELVHMIAHFYYKAKRPSWIDKSKVTPFC